jgi:hypothetical protein
VKKGRVQHKSTPQEANKDLDISGTYFKILEQLIEICIHKQTTLKLAYKDIELKENHETEQNLHNRTVPVRFPFRESPEDRGASGSAPSDRVREDPAPDIPYRGEVLQYRR